MVLFLSFSLHFKKAMNIKHILVVDDDTRIRDLLGKFLRENGFFVTLAKDASDAREKLQEFRFDLLVVDIMMPGESGIELTAALRKEMDVPILMLTAMGETEDRIAGFESGADDYLPKPFEPRELLLRIKSILQRTKSNLTDANIIAIGDLSFDMAKAILSNGDEIIALTSNEEKLLTILCQRRGKIVSREDLSKLCGGVNERSIDVQITRLRNKIEKDSKRPVYLKTVRGQGYVVV